MRWLLFAVFMVGCNSNHAHNMIACKEACSPNGVKKYDEEEGCICNKCPGDRAHEEKDIQPK